MNQESKRGVKLPPRIDAKEPGMLPSSRQITLVGANGAGKSLFMEELTALCGDRAYCLSAIGASYPKQQLSKLKGSIDKLYARAIESRPYLRDSAVSEINKLAFLLFTDELEYLLSVKTSQLGTPGSVELKMTKLDKLARLWRRIFPESRIVKRSGQLMFANESGDDTFTPDKLSRGEKTALYFIAGALYAMRGAVIFIEEPTLFLHPAILHQFWNAVEELRPDCTFIYDTVDADFVASRTQNICIWVKSFDAGLHAWNYEVLPAGRLGDDLMLSLIGSRKPVLFIEGDATHSIDAKLYSLVFQEYNVRPLGSCDKVIESTRSFNDLRQMHHLDSRGIVDRDRRTDVEVGYLRRKNILVPEVAEVENMFLTEGVIAAMARRRGKDAAKVVAKVKGAVMTEFGRRCEEQALQHVRHRMKREIECKIDGRFTCITALEMHVKHLINILRPRDHYNELCRSFRAMLEEGDYEGVLRVFNHKPMLADSGVAAMLGFSNRDAYIAGVLSALKSNDRDAQALRDVVKHCFRLNPDNSPEEGSLPPSRQELKKEAGQRDGNPSATHPAETPAAPHRNAQRDRQRKKRRKERRNRRER